MQGKYEQKQTETNRTAKPVIPSQHTTFGQVVERSMRNGEKQGDRKARLKRREETEGTETEREMRREVS